MNCNISSNKFSHPFLKDLLQALNTYFTDKDISFYVIGATARDIIIKQLADQESVRHTQDLDIAIAIPNWDKFEEIASEISKLKDFENSKSAKQRFFFRKVYELDIVPFGPIANADGNIYWPPDAQFAMSVKGFDEALKDYLTFKIDHDFEIKIASLSGLFLLKLNAWVDRKLSTSKDAEDLCYIISVYFDIFEAYNSERDFHQDIYEDEDFDTFVAGAIWIGYDIKELLSAEQALHYNSILLNELEKEEESQLIEHMMKLNHAASYELILKALLTISDILKQNENP